MLSHKYTEANLKMEHLKGKDRSKAQCLLQACQKQGYSLFLANIEQEVFGICDEDEDGYGYGYGYGGGGYSRSIHEDDDIHSMCDEESRNLTLKLIVRPDGSVRARELPLEEENILQPSPFDRRPDAEDYSGCTGNEGVTTTYFYRDSCVIIMPNHEEDLDTMIYKSSFDSASRTREVLNSLMIEFQEAERKKTGGAMDPTSQRCRRRLSKFCLAFATEYHYYGPSDNIFEDFVTATLAIDDAHAFKVATQQWPHNLQSPIFRNIGTAFASKVSDPSEWQAGIITVIKKSIKSIGKMWAVLSEVREGFEAGLKAVSASSQGKMNLELLNNWINVVMARNLPIDARLDADDGRALINVAQAVPNSDHFLFQTVLPYLKSNLEKKHFTFAFLRAVYHSCKEKGLSERVATSLYRDIMSDFGTNLLDFKEGDKLSKRGCGTWHKSLGMYGPADPKGPRIRVDPTDLADLCGQCLSLGLNDEIHVLFQEIIMKSREYDTKFFETTWIPFLRDFLPWTNYLSEKIRDQCRPIFQSVIDNYVRHYLMKSPPTPVVTMPTQLGCKRCDPCRELDRFLVDPHQEVGRFNRKESIRNHMLKQIGNHYRTAVEKRGSPYPLLVYKRPDEYKAVNMMAEYKKRRAQITKDIESIGIPKLNKLLGTKGNELIDFDSPRNLELVADVQRTPLAEDPSTTTRR